MNFWEYYPKDRLLTELSLWSSDLTRLAEEIKRTEYFADLFHIDVADGHYSNRLLFFPDLVARLRKITPIPFHVHLMIDNQILMQQIDDFIEAGASIITIFSDNIEAVPEVFQRIKNAQLAAGVSLKVEEPIEKIIPYLDHIQLVTMMGTAIGIKGQSLSNLATTRIEQMNKLIKVHGYEQRVKIAADGGIRANTVANLRAAGADTVVMGSLAYESEDLQKTMNWIWSLSKDIS